jgi:alanine racemase
MKRCEVRVASGHDDLKHHFTLSQINLFEKMSSRIIAELGINPIRHILNTSGISNYPEAQFDMVFGIGVYGVSNDPAEQKYLENGKSVIPKRTITAGESGIWSKIYG